MGVITSPVSVAVLVAVCGSLNGSGTEHASNADTGIASPPVPGIKPESATPDTSDTEPPPPYATAPDADKNRQDRELSRFAKPDLPQELGSMTIKQILAHLGGVFPIDKAVVDSTSLEWSFALISVISFLPAYFSPKLNPLTHFA